MEFRPLFWVGVGILYVIGIVSGICSRSWEIIRVFKFPWKHTPQRDSPGDFSDLTWCQTTRRAPSGIILLGAVSKHKVGKQLGHLGSAEWSANERSGWPFSPMTSKGFNKVGVVCTNQSLAVVFFDWTNIQHFFLNLLMWGMLGLNIWGWFANW